MAQVRRTCGADAADADGNIKVEAGADPSDGAHEVLRDWYGIMNNNSKS